jgi:N-acetylneuraminic acid mutarotase
MKLPLLLLMSLPLDTVAAEWQRMASLPEPNGGFVTGVVDGQIFLAGGTNWEGGSKRWLDRVFTYDPARDAWRERSRLEAPLAYVIAAADADGLWIAGGSSGAATHRALRKVERDFSVRTVATCERGFVYAGGARLGDTLYIVGGSDDQARFDKITNEVHALDLRSGALKRLAELPEPAYGVGATAACGGRVFVFGGYHATGPTDFVNHASAWRFSPAENRWEPLPPMPAAHRGNTAVALDERHIFVAGGYKHDPEGFTAESFIFDTAEKKYRASKPLPHAGIVGLVQLGEHLYCLAGEDAKAHRTDAVWRIPWRALVE